MRRRFTIGSSILVTAALAVAIYTIPASRRDSRLPPLPDLREKPARLKAHVHEAYRRARRQADKADSVGHLAMVLHANLFYEAAAPCYQRARELDPSNLPLKYYLAVLMQTIGESEGIVELLSEIASSAPKHLPAQLRLADAQRSTAQFSAAEAGYRACLTEESFAPFARLGLARVAMEQRDWLTAESELRSTLEAMPRHGAALDLLAIVLRELGRDTEARAAQRSAESALRGLQPPDPWLDDLHAFCFDPDYLMVMADAAVQTGDGMRAWRFYQQAMDAAPASARVRLEFATALVKQAQYADAMPLIKQAIALDAQNIAAHILLAGTLMDNGRLDAAVGAARRAVSHDSRSADAHNILGAALTRQGHLAEASAAYTAALRIDPDHTRANVNLGNILSQAGQLDAAAEHFQHALSVTANDSQALTGMGALLARQNRLDEAAQHCRRAVRVNPDSAGAHYNLGIVLAQQGRLEQAILEYRETIRLVPGHFAALLNLGAELSRQGKLDEAIAFHKRALLIQPNSADLHNNLGFAYAARGNRALAIEHYKRALAINPAHPRAKVNLDRL